jgi:transcriptional regulator with XRE-family HTH domain
MTLDEIIKKLVIKRIELGLDLRRVPNMSAATLNRYERRKTVPDIIQLELWAEGLGFNLTYSLEEISMGNKKKTLKKTKTTPNVVPPKKVEPAIPTRKPKKPGR